MARLSFVLAAICIGLVCTAQAARELNQVCVGENSPCVAQGTPCCPNMACVPFPVGNALGFCKRPALPPGCGALATTGCNADTCCPGLKCAQGVLANGVCVPAGWCPQFNGAGMTCN